MIIQGTFKVPWIIKAINVNYLCCRREDVTESTVQNCIAKAGISVEELDRAQNDLYDPFSELRSSLEEKKRVQSRDFFIEIIAPF